MPQTSAASGMIPDMRSRTVSRTRASLPSEAARPAAVARARRLDGRHAPSCASLTACALTMAVTEALSRPRLDGSVSDASQRQRVPSRQLQAGDGVRLRRGPRLNRREQADRARHKSRWSPGRIDMYRALLDALPKLPEILLDRPGQKVWCAEQAVPSRLSSRPTWKLGTVARFTSVDGDQRALRSGAGYKSSRQGELAWPGPGWEQAGRDCSDAETEREGARSWRAAIGQCDNSRLVLQVVPNLENDVSTGEVEGFHESPAAKRVQPCCHSPSAAVVMQGTDPHTKPRPSRAAHHLRWAGWRVGVPAEDAQHGLPDWSSHQQWWWFSCVWWSQEPEAWASQVCIVPCLAKTLCSRLHATAQTHTICSSIPGGTSYN